jgi:hypothetical protein
MKAEWEGWHVDRCDIPFVHSAFVYAVEKSDKGRC